MSKISIALVAVALSICGVAQGQNNLLGNADFESNPPPNLGNNIGSSAPLWVVVGATQNVVKVDGPGGFDYGSSGPENDASAPGTLTPQHYLDLTAENGTFYQTFKAPCEGTIQFGGWFSTRDNKGGTGSITLRQGVGATGAIVATIPVNLPAGNSKFAPWTLVSSTISVPVGTYSFVVSMDQSLNFDNAFVTYKTPCDVPCMTADVVKVSCEKDGTFTVTTTVTNFSGHPVQYVLISTPPGATYTVSPNVVNYGGPITVTVSGATPGQQICLIYQLQDKEGRTCCMVRRCFTLPVCACMTVSKEKITCDPGPAAYIYTFDIKNETNSPIDQLFVIPSIGSVSPQLVPVNLAPGASTTVTVHLSGVSAGQTVCLLLQASGAELKECCTIRVCIKLPQIIPCDSLPTD